LPTKRRRKEQTPVAEPTSERRQADIGGRPSLISLVMQIPCPIEVSRDQSPMRVPDFGDPPAPGSPHKT